MAETTGAENTATRIERIGRLISALEREVRMLRPGQVSAVSTANPATIERHIYRFRRHREAVLGPIFGEPAWDILLDLYRARECGTRVSISSACIASAVPATTALRWLTTLAREQLITTRPDPADGRRRFVELTEHGAGRMREVLEYRP